MSNDLASLSKAILILCYMSPLVTVRAQIQPYDPPAPPVAGAHPGIRLQARVVESGIRKGPGTWQAKSFLRLKLRIELLGEDSPRRTVESIFFGSSKNDVTKRLLDWHEDALPPFPGSKVVELEVQGVVDGQWEPDPPSGYRGRRIQDWIVRVVSHGVIEVSAWSTEELRAQAEGRDQGFNKALIHEHLPYAEERQRRAWIEESAKERTERKLFHTDRSLLAEAVWPGNREVKVEDLRLLYGEARLDAWRKAASSRKWRQSDGNSITNLEGEIFAGSRLESFRSFVVWRYLREKASSMSEATAQFSLKSWLRSLGEIASAAETGDVNTFVSRITAIRSP